MAAIDYAGLNHDLYFGDKTGKTSSKSRADLDFDNDKDGDAWLLSMARTSDLSNR